jgi:hypothetical protein
MAYILFMNSAANTTATIADVATLTLLNSDTEIMGMLASGMTTDTLVCGATMAHEAGQMTEAERDRLVAVAWTYLSR